MSPSAGPKVPPATPNLGVITVGKVAARSGTQPKIPMHVLGHRTGGRPRPALTPVMTGPIGPDVNFADRPQCARLHDCRRAAQPASCRSLVSHLRDDLRLAGDLRDPPRFSDAVRHWLLAIDRLAFAQGTGRDHRVHVVGSAHRYRVDLPRHLVEQLAKIIKLLRAGKTHRCFVQGVFVDIADCDDITLPRGFAGVTLSHASHADASEVELLRRRGRAVIGGLCDPQPSSRRLTRQSF